MRLCFFRDQQNIALTADRRDGRASFDLLDHLIDARAFQSPGDVIETALAMLLEEVEDGIISETRRGEPRFTLEVETELRALGKLK